MKIDFPLALSSWNQEEIDAIKAVIKDDMYSMGPRVASFEREFAKKFNSKYCVMVNSGSSANLLMIAAMFFKSDAPLQRGDEIIVPAVSWSTTYSPLQQYGLRVKFVDVCPETLNLDLDKFEKAVSVNTKAVMLVNILGNCNNYDAVNNILSNKGLDPYILEDNCESMGAAFNDITAGTFGAIGTFSLFFSHHMSTMEGGCCLTDDEELYHILLCLRAHGWTRNLPRSNLLTGVKSDKLFDESFKFVLPGYNVRPLEMSGAIGSVQLLKLDDFLSVRRRNAAHFLEAMSSCSSLVAQKETGSSSWFGFSMMLTDEARYTRAQLLSFLDDLGVEYRPIVTGNFLKNTQLLQHFDYEISGTLDGAEKVESDGFFIGNHHQDLRNKIDQLVEQIIQFERSFL